MKKLLALILAACMIFARAACGQTAQPSAPAAEEETEAPAPAEPAAEESQVFLWDNFDDRDPNAKPDNAPNGASLWWDNWANLRAKNEDGAIKLDYRPKEYDPEDYETEDAYFAMAGDWMGNWGEAIDMWSLDGISYCK